MKKFFSLFLLIISITHLANAQNSETQKIEINSKIFNDTREIKVLLPNQYDKFPNRKYKVVYLFDAQSNDFFNYLIATYNYLKSASNHFISPVIFVGIESKDRRFEFLPKNKTDQPFQIYGSNAKLGGADLMLEYLDKEVIPLVEKRFRSNSYNIAIGHSLGASFITYSLIDYPKMFDALIAISPNYYYDNEQILNSFKAIKNKDNLSNKFIYIAHGKGDELEDRFSPSTEKMRKILENMNIQKPNWSVNELNNNSHALTPLEGIFKGFVKLNEQLTIDETSKSFYSNKYNFIANFQEFYKNSSQSTGLKLPTIEDANHLAYNCFYSNMTKEGIEVLEYTIQLYPNDSNLYDSLGEFYQSIDDKLKAKLSYQNGMKIPRGRAPEVLEHC